MAAPREAMPKSMTKMEPGPLPEYVRATSAALVVDMNASCAPHESVRATTATAARSIGRPYLDAARELARSRREKFVGQLQAEIVLLDTAVNACRLREEGEFEHGRVAERDGRRPQGDVARA